MADGGEARPTFAIVVTAVWGVLLLPGLLAAALSSMFFDAPGSMNDPRAWINVLIVASFPCLCILAIVLVWIVWFANRRRASRGASRVQVAIAFLPLVPVAYVVAATIVETAGVIFSGQPMGLHSTIIHH